MALVSCGDADVLGGELHFPARGAWWARLRLDTATAPALGSSVTIEAADGFSLSGTVTRVGDFLDSAHVRVVGGAAGMAKQVPAASYRHAQLRDPLDAIAGAAGESLASSIAANVLSVSLPAWTLTSGSAARLTDELCHVAGAALGAAVGWRILGAGTLWLGAESWPSSSLPADADVLEEIPDEGRYVIGVATPALLPGVYLEDVDANVTAVAHYIEPDQIRTWAWTSSIDSAP